MYTSYIHAGVTVRDSDGKQIYPNETPDAPEILEYVAWLEAGNAPHVVEEKSEEQLLQEKRALMVLSSADARLKLASMGLLIPINTAIHALPDDHRLKIKWEYSAQMHRLDPDLVDFCSQKMGFNDAAIDALFE